MMELLKLVGIDYLVERWQKDMPEGESGWDYETKWEDVLSLGEQQRTGMARLFFHKPKFGVLDECAHCIPWHTLSLGGTKRHNSHFLLPCSGCGICS